MTEEYVQSSSELKGRISRSWDRWSANYDRHHDSREDDAWKRFLSEQLGRKQLKILDAGTGTGFLHIPLVELGHKVVGVDLSQGMMSICRRKAQEKGLEIDLRMGDVESLDLEDESFDAVVSRWVLWTLPHPDKALKERRRVVKPGGKILAFETPFVGRDKDKAGKRIRGILGKVMISIIEKRDLWDEQYDKEIDDLLPLNY